MCRLAMRAQPRRDRRRARRFAQKDIVAMRPGRMMDDMAKHRHRPSRPAAADPERPHAPRGRPHSGNR